MAPIFIENDRSTMSEAMGELFRRSRRGLVRPSKTLAELFPYTIATHGNLKHIPLEFTSDSRRVEIGSVFFAIDGNQTDGHAFIPEAITRGACAIVSQRTLPAGLSVTAIQVADVRQAMAEASRRFWGNPEKKLSMVAVAGSKGKTSLTHLLRELLKNAEVDAGALSTIQNDMGARAMASFCTTPEPIELYSYLAQMSECGCSHAVVEISEAGILQQRISGISFDVAVLTQLDDIHQYEIFSRLFKGELGARPKIAVINLDDPLSLRLHGEIHETVETITYGSLPACDLQLQEIMGGIHGSEFIVKLGSRRYKGSLGLIGPHNATNAMAALATTYAMGLSVKDAVAALESVEAPAGRLAKVKNSRQLDIFVDYAHTAEDLGYILKTLKAMTQGKLITVFGCGGSSAGRGIDAKREIESMERRIKMTQAVMKFSDLTIATADNPRGEKIEEIFAMMKGGAVNGGEIEFIENRREAIATAIEAAQPGDCILIAGKGHETTQELGGSIIPFDDRSVAQELLKETVHA